MQSSRTIVIAAAGLALLIGAVALVPVANAAQDGTLWDKYQRCTIGCNESYGGTGTFKQGGGGEGYSLCRVRCERRYWKDFDKAFRGK